MSISPRPGRSTVTLAARAFGLEGLRQAATVGHLGERVGGDLVGQAAQFAFQFAHAGFQFGGTLTVGLQAFLRTAHRVCTLRLSSSMVAHHAGQAFQRLGAFNGLHVLGRGHLEAARVFTQFAHFQQHVVNELLERVARGHPFGAHLLLVGARFGQHLARGLHGTHAQAVRQARLQAGALATCPAVVLGQVGDAGCQLLAQGTQAFDQAVAVCKQAPRLLANERDLGHTRRCGAFGRHRVGQAGQPCGQRGGAWFVGGQPGAHRALQVGHQRRPFASRHLGGGLHFSRGIFGTGLGGVGGLVALPGRHQRLQPVQQTLRVTAAAVEHTAQALLAPRGGPLAAAAVQVARQTFHQCRPGQALGLGFCTHCHGLARFFGVGPGVVFGRGLLVRLGQAAQGPLGHGARRGGDAGGFHQR
jgi:hypothetical protein